jgi:rhodanese-related sulfurtransferase
LDRKELKVVTICQSGHRSAIAMMSMQLLGFKDVKSLAGGLNAWNAGK